MARVSGGDACQELLPTVTLAPPLPPPTIVTAAATTTCSDGQESYSADQPLQGARVRRRRRRAAASKQSSSTGSGGVHGSGAAARVFARWVLETYGVKYLQSSSGGVLDVAGGKGHLSLLLRNHSGGGDGPPLQSTVVDPRALDLGKAVEKLRSWKSSPKNPQRTVPVGQSTQVEVHLPHHWPIFWERRVWEDGATEMEQSSQGNNKSNLVSAWHTAHSWEDTVRNFKAKISSPDISRSTLLSSDISSISTKDGCWKCMPLLSEALQANTSPMGQSGSRQEVPMCSDDGFSGWAQHKAFQCPWAKQVCVSVLQ